jgi:hypothetical protein
LIPADPPDASGLMSRAIDERKPIAIVFPDGSDVLARPPAVSGATLLFVHGLPWLAEHLRRKRDRTTFVPREWVTEFSRGRGDRQAPANRLTLLSIRASRLGVGAQTPENRPRATPI